MLELNNQVPPKNKKSILFSIAIIYIVVAILITTCSILFYKNTGKSILEFIWHKNNKSQKEIVENAVLETDKKQEQSNIHKNKLTDKYADNNIELKVIKKEIKQDYEYMDEAERSFKNKIKYYEISGLKDKEIQEKINLDIKQNAESLIVQEELEDERIDYITIEAEIMGNFSNVLSINVYKNINYKNEFVENDVYYENSWLGLNYRLDTGEELEFKDLFFETASIKNILSRTLYEQIAFNYGMEHMYNSDINMGGADMDDIDYSKIEVEVFKIIDSYNKGKKFEFYFTPFNIYVILDSSLATIEMDRYIEHIRIFNLIKPEKSLYENGDLEKINYVFSVPYIANCPVFKKISDDIFLSIFSYYDLSLEDGEKFRKKVEDNLDYIIDLIKQNERKPENNNGKGKIYNFNNIDIYGDMLTAHGEKIEVNLENFDEEIDRVYADACKTNSNVEFILTLYDYDKEPEKVFDIQIEEDENSNKILYQKRNLDLFWVGTDGSKKDLYGNIFLE